MNNITLFENSLKTTFKDSKYVYNLLEEAFINNIITKETLNNSLINVFSLIKQYVCDYIDEEDIFMSEKCEKTFISNVLYEYGFYIFSNFSQNAIDKILNASIEDIIKAQKFMEKTLLDANLSILEVLKIAEKVDVLDFMYLVKSIEQMAKYFYRVNQRVIFESYEEYIEPITQINLPERTLLQVTMGLNIFPKDLLSFLLAIHDLEAESEFLALFNPCDVLNVYSNFAIKIKIDNKVTTTYYHNVAEAIFVQFLFCNYYYTKEPLSLQFDNEQVKKYIYDILVNNLTAKDLIEELDLSCEFIKLTLKTQEYFKSYLNKLESHINTLKSTSNNDNVENWLPRIYERSSN